MSAPRHATAWLVAEQRKHELLERARRLGVDEVTDEVPLSVLVRAIQAAEGRDPCFSTDKRLTCNTDCEWRAECRKLRACWLR